MTNNNILKETVGSCPPTNFTTTCTVLAKKGISVCSVLKILFHPNQSTFY